MNKAQQTLGSAVLLGVCAGLWPYFVGRLYLDDDWRHIAVYFADAPTPRHLFLLGGLMAAGGVSGYLMGSWRALLVVPAVVASVTVVELVYAEIRALSEEHYGS